MRGVIVEVRHHQL